MSCGGAGRAGKGRKLEKHGDEGEGQQWQRWGVTKAVEEGGPTEDLVQSESQTVAISGRETRL